MPFDPKDTRNLVIALGLGALGGAAIMQSHHDEAAKSQAEKDDPDGCVWLCDLIWELLDDWEPPGYYSENEYTDDLVRFLRRKTRDITTPYDDEEPVTVEKRQRTPFGVPDVRIDNRLVLELKVGPHEGEKDRLIGQCVKYSVEWVTWAIVIDMDEEKQEELIELLKKKSLHYIEVVPYEDKEGDEDD
jgi:hypothetical protein